MATGYNGVFGAFPYAFRRSRSLLFKSYVVLSAFAVALVALFVVIAIVVLLGRTAAVQGGSLTLSRAFFIVIGLLVVLPAVAPTLAVARRYRRDIESTPRYEVALAVAGYLFLFSLYLGAVASMPETFVLDGETVTRPPPSGLFAPVVALLYAIPQALSWIVPLCGALLVAAAHRLFG
ncbi:hypothetical protein C474_04098 [Halogeometricum pallidum JCM 14848]|uniref:DUF8056 domain-containing protein n=1 Tax=Halogeometricum pallidum JCM 14848 TaxID=1227487 RepID=M0DHH4_HALPD|nr:hypothetical protein [Halogeometricum pallidum]ELZ33614.1 hypothetical protein C474_04098 [Halogeometricum pallidum JCM 14848]